jgi:hypothetical protein
MSVGDVVSSRNNGPVVFNLIFFTMFGVVGYGSYWRWQSVRHVRNLEKANAVSTST